MEYKEYGSKNKDIIILLHGGGLSWWNYIDEIGYVVYLSKKRYKLSNNYDIIKICWKFWLLSAVLGLPEKHTQSAP